MRLKCDIDLKLKSEDMSSTWITDNEVLLAIQAIHNDKRDAFNDLYTNHLKQAPPVLHNVLSRLFNSMICHGYNPEQFIKSVIISIPKDYRKSLSDSGNHRGIAIGSILCKVYDTVMKKKIQFINWYR